VIAVIAVACGVATWTFLEYVIHRFLGHGRRWRKNPFGVEHIRHHIEGDYFAPTWKKLVFAMVVAALLGVLGVALAGRAIGIGYVAGLIGFYGMYEWQHRREHTHGGIGAYGRWARRHHFRHHLVDARTNFGVTTPFWDLVFGTYRKPGVIKVPPRLRMIWLVDPSTGAIHDRYADAFMLGTGPRSEAR